MVAAWENLRRGTQNFTYIILRATTLGSGNVYPGYLYVAYFVFHRCISGPLYLHHRSYHLGERANMRQLTETRPHFTSHDVSARVCCQGFYCLIKSHTHIPLYLSTQIRRVSLPVRHDPFKQSPPDSQRTKQKWPTSTASS
jgi:hypothetical protein